MLKEKSHLARSAQSAEVWFVDVAACVDALQAWQGRAEALDGATKARLERIKMDDERMTRFSVHCALRILIERIKGPSWRGKPLVYSDKGQPSLPGLGQTLSLSHTKGAGLIALTPGSCVGVDIEPLNRRIKMQAARQQAIISAAGVLTQAGHHEPQLTFISAWVRLEAYAKATGQGLAPLLSEVMAPLRQKASPTMASVTKARADNLAIYSLEVAPNFVAAVALGKADPSPEVHRFPCTETEIVEMLAMQ